MGILDKIYKRITAERGWRSKASTKSRRGYLAAEGMQHVLVGLGQSTGLERRHNEDALLVTLNCSAGEETMIDFGLFIVADGMGGHRSGEVASAIASRAVAKHLNQEVFSDLFDVDSSPRRRAPLLDVVRQAFVDANRQVVRMLPGGGTTLTAVVLLGEQLTIGHVGDSRAYVIGDDEAKAITRDHTFVERLLELGEVTQEEANNHPQRHVLYRAIGQGESLEIDVFTHPTPHGGMLLICSDGLWSVVPDDEILNIIHQASSPQEACDELVHAANQGGGPDNITAVLVQFPPKAETSSQQD
jgi:protein phosphatase